MAKKTKKTKDINEIEVLYTDITPLQNMVIDSMHYAKKEKDVYLNKRTNKQVRIVKR